MKSESRERATAARRTIGGTMVLLLAALVLGGSRRAPAESDSVSVGRALDRYVVLVEAMASDRIAQLFTADGRLLAEGREPVVGPPAIARYLHGFDAYHVLAESMTVERVLVSADTAWQSGTFAQHVRLPAGDTVRASGGFAITWVRTPHGPWRIREMGTRPPATEHH